MGYEICLTLSTTTMVPANWPVAYARLCALNDRDDLKTGGSAECNQPRPAGMDHHPNRWFTGMDPNYPAKCSTVQEVLEMLGFEVGVIRASVDPEEVGLLSFEGFSGSSRDLDYFIEAIGSLLEGEMFWTGEDGSHWKWEFPDTRQLDGTVVYS